MGVEQSLLALLGAADVGGAYEIEQSLRFDGSSYLSRTFSAISSFPSSGTLSFWIKLTGTTSETIFDCRPNSSYLTQLDLTGDRELQEATNIAAWQIRKNPGNLRDQSAWMHVVYQYQSQSTGNSVKFFINGVQTSSHAADSRNINYFWGNTGGATMPARIGQLASGGNPFHGYLAEFHSCNGNHYAPTEFGEYDENGVWRPIETSGLTYGTNGFYLKFDPSAANGIGHDHSGSGTHFTPTGFTTSGTGTDVMSDTPTTNWCTLSPAYKAVSGATFSEGNLKVAYPSSPPTGMHVGTLATTNAFYVEAKATAATSNQIYLGVDTPAHGNINNNIPGGTADGWGYGMNGRIYNNGSSVTDTGITYTTNDVIGIACNPSSGTIEFFKNGTSVYSNTSVANVPLTICVAQNGGSGNSGTIQINCGQGAFEQTAPSGFSPLNTSNLPAPDIADGSDYFQTVLYTGNGADRNIDVTDNSDNNWQPDLVWIKQRSGSATDHRLFDQVRGGGAVIRPNNTNAEQTAPDDGIYFAYADGFNIDYGTNGANYNGSGQTYVAWNWLAANGTSTPSGGSIASTVSANPTAGFSIVSYVGTFAAETIAHGLGNAPSMIITKSRDTADRWQVYHSALGNGYTLRLEIDTAAGADAGAWNSTSPTSTVFSVGASVRTNRSGDDFIAYCFAEVEGYSKFGSYTGNGSTDGPFVYCGFRPSWILIKRSSSTGSWVIYDVKRDTYNLSQKRLFPDLDAIEESSSTRGIDILSNGFKARNNHDSINGSGTYIFAAFAENPFGGSGVSPATAR